ncbi:hypothetical protein AAMO2058_001540400 [Amorphochlora amoebiformis]
MLAFLTALAPFRFINTQSREIQEEERGGPECFEKKTGFLAGVLRLRGWGGEDGRKTIELIRIKRRRVDMLPGEIAIDDIPLPKKKMGRGGDLLAERLGNMRVNNTRPFHVTRYRRIVTLTSSQMKVTNKRGPQALREIIKRTRTADVTSTQTTTKAMNASSSFLSTKRERGEGGGGDTDEGVEGDRKRVCLTLMKATDKNADYEVMGRSGEDSEELLFDVYEKERTPSTDAWDELGDRFPPIYPVLEGPEYELTSGVTEDAVDQDDSNAEGYYKNEYPSSPKSTKSMDESPDYNQLNAEESMERIHNRYVYDYSDTDSYRQDALDSSDIGSRRGIRKKKKILKKRLMGKGGRKFREKDLLDFDENERDSDDEDSYNSYETDTSSSTSINYGYRQSSRKKRAKKERNRNRNRRHVLGGEERIEELDIDGLDVDIREDSNTPSDEMLGRNLYDSNNYDKHGRPLTRGNRGKCKPPRSPRNIDYDMQETGEPDEDSDDDWREDDLGDFGHDPYSQHAAY